ncbi:MAG: GntR family transcriptional regulator [Oscillospiraceae bacterium]|nr:GntR family transcriptional regulator [Oscillospiraceae bacterium]
MKNAPLYKKIVKYVKDNIDSGKWTADMKIPSERELAEMFNVSSITTKRALTELTHQNLIYRRRGSGSYVKASDFINEEKSNVHKFPALNKTVTFVVPVEVSWSGTKHCINGINDFLADKNYEMNVCVTSNNSSIEGKVLRSLAEKKMGGIILYPHISSENVDLIIAISTNGIPVVAIDKTYDAIPISSVTSDNYAGGYMQTEYLLKAGHKKIVYMADVPIAKATSVRERYLGYCNALKDYSIGIDGNISIFIDSDKSINNENIGTDNVYSSHRIHLYNQLQTQYKHEILQLCNNGATAFVCNNDDVANGVCALLEKCGINVPIDVSIVGYDNKIQYDLNKKLTTIDQDFYTMGYKAAELVVRHIEGKKQKVQHIKVPVTMVDGETVKRLGDKEPVVVNV